MECFDMVEETKSCSAVDLLEGEDRHRPRALIQRAVEALETLAVVP